MSTGAIIGFDNMNCFFKLDLTVQSSFTSSSQGDHVWHADVLEVSGRWEGEVGDSLLVLLTYYDENYISKKLDFEPDMLRSARP
ncbi:unnamed protein product [Prunus armeniaca]